MRDGWVGGAWVSGGGVPHERFCWPAVLHFFLALFIYLFIFGATNHKTVYLSLVFFSLLLFSTPVFYFVLFIPFCLSPL